MILNCDHFKLNCSQSLTLMNQYFPTWHPRAQILATKEIMGSTKFFITAGLVQLIQLSSEPLCTSPMQLYGPTSTNTIYLTDVHNIYIQFN